MTSLAILVDDNDQPLQENKYSERFGAAPMNDVPAIVLLCDHCDAEYCDIGAPLACGHNICGCDCKEECPDVIEELIARAVFDRVLEQLLWVVPRYEE